MFDHAKVAIEVYTILLFPRSDRYLELFAILRFQSTIRLLQDHPWSQELI